MNKAAMAEEGRWSNLSNDILSLILKRLHTQLDLTRFRSICKSWRSFAISSQTHLLFPLSLPPLYPNSYPLYLHPTLIYLISSYSKTPFHNPDNRPCLIKVSETGNNKLTLFNPLGKSKNKLNFPSGVSQKWINLMGFRCFEVGRLYKFKSVFGDIPIDFDDFPYLFSIKKVAVKAFEEIVVLGLLKNGEIALCRLGDAKWKTFDVGCKDGKEKMKSFDDVVCYNGKFYIVDGQGRLIVVDSTTFELIELIAPIEFGDYDHYAYLVESNSRLYMVIKIDVKPMSYYVDKVTTGRSLAFKVYVFSGREKRWERVESLGNKVFFVSGDASFSVCAKDLGWEKGNCIYFEGLMGYESYDGEVDMGFGLNVGVYNMEDQDIVAFSSLEDPQASIFCLPSSWFLQA